MKKCGAQYLNKNVYIRSIIKKGLKKIDSKEYLFAKQTYAQILLRKEA